MSKISKELKIQILASLILLGIIFLTSSYLYFSSIFQPRTFTPENISSSTTQIWNYYKITPSASGESTLLTLKSDTGEIKEIKELNAYGLSSNKNLVGAIAQQTFTTYNLDNDTSFAIDTGLENFKFNFGNSINWSFDDKYVATSILDLENNSTFILLINIQDQNSVLIPENIPYTKEYIEPTYFSKVSEKIIVRSYNQLDLEFPNDQGVFPSRYEVPAYLSVYNYTNSELFKKEMILEFPLGKFIDYGFDFSGLAKYYVSDQGLNESIADYKYIKIAI